MWSYEGKVDIVENQMSVSRLYAIQWEFYEYLFRALMFHFLYFLCLFCFVKIYKLRFRSFLRAFLLSISVKIVFLPLLVWTKLDQFFWPFIFIKLISIVFFSIQMELNSKFHFQFYFIISAISTLAAFTPFALQ